MSDATLQWSGDLAVSATGDVGLANGTQLTQQRVLRRLLTSPGDYIWQPAYGAGLGRFVGGTLNVAALTSTIRSQIFQEPGVAATPAPVIDVQALGDGSVYVHLLYVDAATGSTQVLTFTVGA